MKRHRVREGECLSSIAFEHGFFAGSLWEHPENAELAKLRGDMNCLCPGDVVFIPDKRPGEAARPTGARHSFRLRTTPVKFKVRLLADGRPRARVPYRLVIGSATVAGTTDDDGRIEAWVSPVAPAGTLHVEDDTFEVLFRHLAPATEIRGVQQRLRNLRLYRGPAHGEVDDETREAIKAFQRAEGLPATGEVDPATAQALDARHGGEGQP